MRYQGIRIETPAVENELLIRRERGWHHKLPESFKVFIKENNGLIPEKRVSIDGNVIERFLCVVTPVSESPDGIYDMDVIATKYDVYLAFDENAQGVGLIPFAQVTGGKLLCLCYDGEIPSVVLWQLEGSEVFMPHYKKLCDSFESFCNYFLTEISPKE